MIWRSNGQPVIDPGRGIVFPFEDGDLREMDEALKSGDYWITTSTINGDDGHSTLIAQALKTRKLGKA